MFEIIIKLFVTLHLTWKPFCKHLKTYLSCWKPESILKTLNSLLPLSGHRADSKWSLPNWTSFLSPYLFMRWTIIMQNIATLSLDSYTATGNQGNCQTNAEDAYFYSSFWFVGLYARYPTKGMVTTLTQQCRKSCLVIFVLFCLALVLTFLFFLILTSSSLLSRCHNIWTFQRADVSGTTVHKNNTEIPASHLVKTVWFVPWENSSKCGHRHLLEMGFIPIPWFIRPLVALKLQYGHFFST